MTSPSPERERLASAKRTDDELRRENAKLREEVAALTAALDGARAGAIAAHESRRAALNLMEDVEKARQAERAENLERRRAEEELRAADRRKDEFLATLAHELRNPLAPIRNAIQILKMQGPAGTDFDWSQEIIERQVQQMSLLLNDLLDVSRISRNRLELRKQRIELASIVRRAVETSRPAIDDGRHELIVELPDVAVSFEADSLRLAQVFSNLLNNAARYTEPGGVIRLRAEVGEGAVSISVSDTGIGIDAQVLPRIFEMFAQADPAAPRSQGGLGVGLSLVRALVELHGGCVTAHSDGLGKGSRFEVKLPLSRCDDAVPEGDRARKPDLAPLRILVADDSRDGADSLARILKLMGHDVDTVYDGDAALALAEEHRPDVAVLDIGMPTLDGREVCSRIRRQDWGKRMVVVALSGWGQVADRKKTLDAGFDHHMVKPANAEHLMLVIESLRAKNRGAPRNEIPGEPSSG